MAQTSLKIRGREFSKKEITLIKNIVHKNPESGRTHISQLICHKLEWVQPNGWPKDRACRDVLLFLEARNLIKLPASKVTRTAKTIIDSPLNAGIGESEEPIISGDINNLKIIMVRQTKYDKKWNELISKYHYLGHKVIVGRHLKYMAFLDNIPVACLGWGDAAWAVAGRDKWIGWSRDQREENIYRIINNTRFLILPWVKLPNLASKILSVNLKRVVQDWNTFYGISPLLAETFVEQNRFIGTCYKAANWIHVGNTSGHKKNGKSHTKHNNIKLVFLYPLHKKAKNTLQNS